MIKIIECYSDKLITRGTLYVDVQEWVSDDNGLNIGTVTAKQKNINISLSPCKDIKSIMFNRKLESMDKEGFLFLASNIKDNPTENKGVYGSLFLAFNDEYNYNNLTKLTIEGNVIYQRSEEVSVNSDILSKIEIVRSKIRTSHKDFDYLKPIEAAVISIERIYVNTAIISKDDLKWLNKVYNSFKEK